MDESTSQSLLVFLSNIFAEVTRDEKAVSTWLFLLDGVYSEYTYSHGQCIYRRDVSYDRAVVWC